MTCIVGISDGINVYMGGDRGMGTQDVILSSSRSKVKINGDYLIGFAGSAGIGELLHFIELPPPERNIEKTLRTSFIYNLKQAIDKYGDASYLENNTTDWLIGTKGRLFEICSEDWSVCEFEYSAIGTGSDIALGSLHTSSRWGDSKKRIKSSLQAAIDISPTCLGPMDILEI